MLGLLCGLSWGLFGLRGLLVLTWFFAGVTNQGPVGLGVVVVVPMTVGCGLFIVVAAVLFLRS